MSKLRDLLDSRKLDVASFLSITNLDESIIDNENFRDLLSADQLRLVSEVLGVPRFLLFGESIPKLSRIPKDFRTIGNNQPRHTKSSLTGIYRVMREAKAIDEWAGSLGAELTDVTIWNKFSIGRDAPSEVAQSIRSFLKIESDYFEKFSDETKALNSFRYSIEKSGINVLMEEIRDHAIRGFCFRENELFFLCLNSERQHARSKIFTLAHELAHIAFGRVGIVDTHSQSLRLEKICNKVAAHLILPDSLLKKSIESISLSPSDQPKLTVDQLHQKLPFSKYFLAIRLQESGFEDFVNSWAIEARYPLRRPAKSIDDLRALNEEFDDYEKGDSDAFRRRGQPLRHFTRLGFNAISLANHAVEVGLVSAFDVQRSLSLPEKYFLRTVEKHGLQAKEAQNER